MGHTYGVDGRGCGYGPPRYGHVLFDADGVLDVGALLGRYPRVLGGGVMDDQHPREEPQTPQSACVHNIYTFYIQLNCKTYINGRRNRSQYVNQRVGRLSVLVQETTNVQ
jgi:hypothetical protein